MRIPLLYREYSSLAFSGQFCGLCLSYYSRKYYEHILVCYGIELRYYTTLVP